MIQTHRNPGDPEFEQVVVRWIVGLCASTFIVVHGALGQTHAPYVSAYIIVAVWFPLTLVHGAAAFYARGPSALRRGLGMVLDFGGLSAGATVLGAPAITLVPFYLFVTFGNGLRFGGRYLVAAMVLACGSLAVAMSFAPWSYPWQVTASVFLSILLLPAYVGILAHRIAKSRDSLDQEADSLKHSCLELEHVNEIKSKFLSAVSHELRTPIMLILGPLQQLRDEAELPASVASYVSTIHDNAHRLLGLVDQLLDVVLYEDATQDGRNFTKVGIELNRFTEALVRSMAPLVRTKNITLDVFTPDAECFVVANEDACKKLLLNLLFNALQFTPPRGSIEVHVHRDGETAILSVVDTGSGISEDDLRHVFEGFFQAGPSSTRAPHGVGIGLRLAHTICRMHGGNISATPLPAGGVRIDVRLPIAKPVELRSAKIVDPPSVDALQASGRYRYLAARHEFSSAPQEREPRELDAPGHTILVVDDEPEMARFIGDILADEHHVLTALNGIEALQLIEEAAPDLILLDVMMPEMDGLAVARQVKEVARPNSPRIIMLTAKTDSDSKVEAFGLGVDDFLTKPFSIPELRARVNVHLRARTMQATIAQQNSTLQAALARVAKYQDHLIDTEKMAAALKVSQGIVKHIARPAEHCLLAIADARKTMNLLDRNTHHLLDQAESLISQIVAAKDTLEEFIGEEASSTFQQVQVSHLLQTALEIAGDRDPPSCCVSLDIPDGDIFVHGEEKSLVLLLSNLIANAIAVCREQSACDGIPVNPVTVGAAPAANGSLRLFVRDEGPGLPSQVRDFLAGRLDELRAGDDIGLGMSLARRIAEAHHTTLDALPLDPRGTEISLVLPTAG